jgi:hypothetical protein
MQDPSPENIDGSKLEKHVFEHRVDWGYVVLGLSAALAVYAVFLRETGEERER